MLEVCMSYFARRQISDINTTYILLPENIPAHPRPVIALPRMKIAEVGAAALIAEPAAKMANEATNTAFIG